MSNRIRCGRCDIGFLNQKCEYKVCVSCCWKYCTDCKHHRKKLSKKYLKELGIVGKMLIMNALLMTLHDNIKN